MLHAGSQIFSLSVYVEFMWSMRVVLGGLSLCGVCSRGASEKRGRGASRFRSGKDPPSGDPTLQFTACLRGVERAAAPSTSPTSPKMSEEELDELEMSRVVLFRTAFPFFAFCSVRLSGALRFGVVSVMVSGGW